MKKMLISLALLVGLYAQAQSSYLTANIGVLTNNVSTNRMVLGSITVASTATNTLTLQLFDNNASANIYTNAAWIVQTLSSGTVTNKWTNDLGMVLTNYYVGLVSTTTTNAAATNQLPVLATIVVPTNSTVTATLGFPVSKGLTYASNATNATMTVTYRSW